MSADAKSNKVESQNCLSIRYTSLLLLSSRRRAARFPLDGTIFNESPELLEERMKDAKFVEDRTKMQELLKWSRKRMLTDGVNGSKVFKEANDTNRTISRVYPSYIQ